jgi:hypothetical protein
MDVKMEKGRSDAGEILRFVIILVGLVAAASLLSLTVSTKVFLIGAAFVALAIWGKRKLKQEHKP